MDIAATIILFVEMPELQWHYNHVIDSLYMTATCQLCLYIFFHRDFVVPLFSPLFDPASPFLAILLYIAHPIPPSVAPPTTPPQLAHPTSFENDPSEMVDSFSSSSSALDNNCAPIDSGMANRFLSSESI